LRTSECGDAASKRLPSRSTSLLDRIAGDEPWVAAVEAFRTRHPRRRERVAQYESILERGVHRRIGADVLAQRYCPEPPTEGWLNKADGRKKRIFQYGPVDELLFRVVHHLVQPAAVAAASPLCRSFLPGGGARAAFRALLTDPDLDAKGALRIDVRDYFNSIDVRHLLDRLPDAFASGAMGALLRASLLDRRVRRSGAIVDGGRKGIMAGTPIAPVLATMYLQDVDREIADAGATYVRYSDDILALAPPAAIPDLERLLRRRLAERRLEVNEEKSASIAPGAPWDFLGFRYARGTISLAPITERKLRMKTTRLARRLLRWRERNAASAERAVSAFVRRTNRRLYGVPEERAEFSWATWFLPMLDGPRGLDRLDHHIQREVRYAATGRRTAETHRRVPYQRLIDAGYLPLVAAFWELRQRSGAYDALVRCRTGLG
jgi:hypothetical protein